MKLKTSLYIKSSTVKEIRNLVTGAHPLSYPMGT